MCIRDRSFSSYQNFWEEFVPRGYIIVFPRTEEGLVNDHQEFGWDLQFLVTKMQEEGVNSNSPIFGAVDNNTALMGHSMGGGAAFLAADSLVQNQNVQLKTIIGLAPTESSSNGVSSISSALNVNIPSVVKSDIKGVKICRQAMAYWIEEFDKRKNPLGQEYYWLTGSFINQDNSEETDEWALEKGYVSVVPISYDMTSHDDLDELKKWKFN